jgi:hypothetical protein
MPHFVYYKVIGLMGNGVYGFGQRRHGGETGLLRYRVFWAVEGSFLSTCKISFSDVDNRLSVKIHCAIVCCLGGLLLVLEQVYLPDLPDVGGDIRMGLRVILTGETQGC